jgi:hypothetical protein
MMHRESQNTNKKLNHLLVSIRVLKELSEAFREGLQIHHPGKPPNTPTTKRLPARYFVERRPPS